MTGLTSKQEDVIMEGLNNAGRSKVIRNYCNNLGKCWTDLSKEEGDELIKMLDYMPLL